MTRLISKTGSGSSVQGDETMITFVRGNRRFNYHIAGVAMREGSVLLRGSKYAPRDWPGPAVRSRSVVGFGLARASR